MTHAEDDEQVLYHLPTNYVPALTPKQVEALERDREVRARVLRQGRARLDEYEAAGPTSRTVAA